MSDPLRSTRESISHAKCADEPQLVKLLLESSALSMSQRQAICKTSVELVERCRERRDEAGTLEAFLQEFGLANKEGIALMCLAEALLRVPDAGTADRLIAEKIQSGDWGSHQGKSDSSFVNASIWGLMLTGNIVRLDPEITDDTGNWLRRLVSKLGETLVHKAVLQAMHIMASQYVMGRTIEEGLQRGIADQSVGTRFSFDMLGEGARTAQAAQAYFEAYAHGIRAISNSSEASSLIDANAISIKLSALCPRFETFQAPKVMRELLPRLKQLAVLAKQGGLGFSIDAEEADRLELTMDLFQQLARDPDLANWNGLGFVLQAYQKRAWYIADWLLALARETGHQFMVRLVKGAYWDSEVKHAQQQGLSDYPVFTRKCHTDLSYQLCAEKLFSAPSLIYPQFATHNAHTIVLVQYLGKGKQYEFQRLHGMGQLLYDELGKQEPVPLRIYAPIGSHRDLLPYLVRRLLENGANSSFVNRFLDRKIQATELIQDPHQAAKQHTRRRHLQIPVPEQMYRAARPPWTNSRGIDLANPVELAPLLVKIKSAKQRTELARDGRTAEKKCSDVINPANTDQVIGRVCDASKEAIEKALRVAYQSQPDWNQCGVSHRADCLEEIAAQMENQAEELIGLIIVEAGRSIKDALSEVREAIDFCRYYAAQARANFEILSLPGTTGETNELSLHGKGVFACISPWNFPLAIFTGQVVAALVAGNSVLAKPAEQTPLIAARAVALMHSSGIPKQVLHLLPGAGAVVGSKLVNDARVVGIAFTGSLATARKINRQLAEREGRIATLIAETGGLNVMLVDATALLEQLVDDIITSSFQSAGQRCSALRVIYLQEELADDALHMLRGAMAELVIGDPVLPSTDIGPIIDFGAREKLLQHSQRMHEEARMIASCKLDSRHEKGFFFAPVVFEISSLSQLTEEVFGPILHVIRYQSQDLDRVIDDINASGFGLTLGIHSRINGFASHIFKRTKIGNTYINRNMVGAVVGVNPFGGHGRSGTGPKAGGPNYLMAFVDEKTRSENTTASGGDAQLFSLDE